MGIDVYRTTMPSHASVDARALRVCVDVAANDGVGVDTQFADECQLVDWPSAQELRHCSHLGFQGCYDRIGGPSCEVVGEGQLTGW